MAADPLLRKNKQGLPSTFYTFSLQDNYWDKFPSCRSCAESIRLVAAVLRALGVENASDAVEAQAEDEGNDSDEED